MAKQDVGARIEGLLDEYLADKELEIYNIEYKKEGKDWKLRIYMDKPIGCDSEYVDINECEDVTPVSYTHLSIANTVPYFNALRVIMEER